MPAALLIEQQESFGSLLQSSRQVLLFEHDPVVSKLVTSQSLWLQPKLTQTRQQESFVAGMPALEMQDELATAHNTRSLQDQLKR